MRYQAIKRPALLCVCYPLCTRRRGVTIQECARDENLADDDPYDGRKKRPDMTGRLFALALLSMAYTGDARQPTRATDAEVTLTIFSGRVDPVWVLNPQQAAELRTRLEHLPLADRAYPAPVNLGYLSVLLPDRGRKRDQVSIDHGKVIWQSRKVIRSLNDPGRALEAWLLATGKGRTSTGERWFELKDLDRHP
jgi:hypothetical protein